jgi:hypothetical protein
MEIVKNIIILILSIISGSIPIVTIILKKYRRAKFDGIEKLSKAIESLKHEKIYEQKRAVRERSDILFGKYLDIFCKNIPVSSESKEAIYYKSIILDSVRCETDKIMNDVIYINNIAGREGRAWNDYKNAKFEFILTAIIRHITMIYRDDVIGIPHDEAIAKCRDDIVKTYMKHINPMFEEIKNISLEYNEKIKEQERVLASLKNGKKK